MTTWRLVYPKSLWDVLEDNDDKALEAAVKVNENEKTVMIFSISADTGNLFRQDLKSLGEPTRSVYICDGADWEFSSKCICGH